MSAPPRQRSPATSAAGRPAPVHLPAARSEGCLIPLQTFLLLLMCSSEQKMSKHFFQAF